MFTERVIKSYNAERGFGFIAIEGNKKDLFFHITDFPNNHIDPKIGEKLKFRIVDDKGKLKADNIVRLDVKIESDYEFDTTNRHRDDFSQSKYTQNSSLQNRQFQNHHSRSPHPSPAHPRSQHTNNTRSSGSWWVTILGLLVIVGLLYMIYGKYQRAQLANQAPVEIQRIADPVDSNANNYSSNATNSNSNSTNYSCDGRIHCSQMNSREEARWFVRNCPGTKMDGNNDGEPCENDSRW